MPVADDRIYEEAVALWRSLSDEPPPKGDAGELLEAALRLCGSQGYDRFQTPWLDDPTLSWAVYRQAPSRLA